MSRALCSPVDQPTRATSSVPGTFQARMLSGYFLLQAIFLPCGVEPGAPTLAEGVSTAEPLGSPDSRTPDEKLFS